jgi:hypothetical protein
VQDFSGSYADGWISVQTTTEGANLPSGTIPKTGFPSSTSLGTAGEIQRGSTGTLPVLGFTAINLVNTAIAGGTNYGQFILLKGLR